LIAAEADSSPRERENRWRAIEYTIRLNALFSANISNVMLVLKKAEKAWTIIVEYDGL